MLSSEQKAIVTHAVNRHALVLAVAGSGKSHTMVERIAYLIEACRVDPAHIIAVMFNKAASVEMTDRLIKRVGKRNSPDAVTYHRLGTLTLKRLIMAGLAEPWEFDANPNRARYFTAKVIERACATNGHKYPALVADAFLGFVDRVKSDLLSPGSVWENGDWPSRYEWFVEWYPIYEKARAKAGLRFFSDLIYDPLIILQGNDKAAGVVGDRYAHIIIDEYQDICEAQHQLIRYTAGTKARVMAVGDDDQTIYAWRGAKPSYILRDFAKDFPEVDHYQLTRTWRYGHALSCAANYVITNNTDRADKLCISGDNAPETKLNLVSEKADGSSVTNIIAKQQNCGRKLSDIAILVRTYSQSGSTQFDLLESSIPFRLEGGDNASVLDNPWVVALLGWMGVAAGRIAARPYAGEPDNTSIFELRKVLNVPGVGLSFDAVKEWCKAVLIDPVDGAGFATFVQEHLKVTDGNLASRIHAKRMLWRKVRGLSSKARKINAYDLLCDLIDELKIVEAINASCSSKEDADELIQLVEAFKSYAETYGNSSLPDFLSHIDDLRSFSERAKAATDAVHMTSVHRSKGLEWECVIMIGLAQGKFPLSSRHISPSDDAWPVHLEDERRLFYVGMTRARRELFLLAPEDLQLHKWLRAGRTKHPELECNGKSASQFLYESNLYLSSMMAAMARKSMDIKATSPEVFNMYLERLGKNYFVMRNETNT